jgi:cell wall-associated NlpC family hydrolase
MGLGHIGRVRFTIWHDRPITEAMVMRTLFVLLAAAATACASSGAVPRPFPTPGAQPRATTEAARPETPETPAPATAAPAPPAPATSAEGYALAGTALSLRGAPYRNQGTDPSGFDCSGFVQYVYQQYGLALPREVREQFRKGKKVDPDELEPGDLVFFTTVAPGASHVGIAIGGDQFVHAPSERGVVRVEQLSATYWRARFVGAKRML